jgi:hypothetical protein
MERHLQQDEYAAKETSTYGTNMTNPSDILKEMKRA